MKQTHFQPSIIMRRFFLLGATLVALQVVASAAFAQRLVLPPFEGDDLAGFALPNAIAHTLSSIDGVALASPLEVAKHNKRFPNRDTAEAFAAKWVVTGEVEENAGTYSAKLTLGAKTLEVKGADFAKLVVASNDAVIQLTGLTPNSNDQKEMTAIEAAMPGVEASYAASSIGNTENFEALVKAGDSPWPLSVRAFTLSGQGNSAEALTLAAKAAKLAPLDVGVQTIAGYLHLIANKPNEAQALLEGALKLNPIHPEALYGLGVAAMRQTPSNPKAAAGFFERALQANPRLIEAALGYADILERAKRTQNALDVLSSTVSLAPEAFELHQQIMGILLRNDRELASQYLTAATARYPEVPDSVYALAVLMPDTDAALTVVANGETRYNDSALLATSRGQLLDRSANYNDSLKAYSEALNRDAAWRPAGLALATTQAKLGQYDAAEKTLQNTLGKNDPKALVRMYIQAARLDKAKPIAAKLEASDAEALYLGAVIALREWRFEDAQTGFEKALKAKPNDAPSKAGLQELGEARLLGVPKLEGEAVFRYRLAQAALDAGSNHEAVTNFKMAFEKSKNAHAQFGYAVALYEIGETEDARDQLQNVLKTLPDNPVVLTSLGAVYLDIGRFDLALETLEKVTKVAPKYAKGWLYLGLANFELGYAAPAKEALLKAVGLDASLTSLVKPYLDALAGK